MQIVNYKTTDSQAVAAFFREIFKEQGWTERLSDHMVQPHLLFHLPNGGLLILAKENGKVLGTAGIIVHNKSEGLMKRFYVSQGYRGSGIAQQLLQELSSQAKRKGIHKIILDVSKNNSRAIHFYEKSGFLPMEVSSREDWPESKEPDTHLYMYKDLVSEY